MNQLPLPEPSPTQLKGMKACMGNVVAPVTVIGPQDELSKFKPGTILVTMKTTPEFTHIFGQAKGIVTQVGGILSHAAIVSREYGIPCIVGVPNVLGYVKDDMIVTLDADNGLLLLPQKVERPKTVPNILPAYTAVSEEEYYCSWCESNDHDTDDCEVSKWCDGCDERVSVDHEHDWDEE